jgi:hypothetical protein
MDPDRISRGTQAQALLDSELYQEVRAEAEADVVARWQAAPTVEAREACHAELLGLEVLHRRLLAVVNEGAVARREAERA